MRPTPILFLSDNPTLSTGLARICRDIVGQLSRNPKFRVGTLGMGGSTTRALPWAQYTFPQDGTWGMPYIRSAWADFAGRERGVVLTIWDVTRTLWLSRPEYCDDSTTQKWLREGHFDLWGYITMDATGPNNKLGMYSRDSLMGYNRLLAYTQWSAGVIERTIGVEEAQRRRLDWLPHGIDFAKWEIRDKEPVRQRFHPLLHEGEQLIGIIGTNQARKDWGLMAQVCRQLLDKHPRLKFWWHIDVLERYWSINGLLHDFDLTSSVAVTQLIPQEELVWCVNACDLTLHPGLGGGFEYPIFESLAVGVPALHGDYAGGADVLRQAQHEDFLVKPVAWRLEGNHSQVRPVYDAGDWVAKVEEHLSKEWDREALRATIAHLGWQSLWPSWERWFEEGL